MDKGTTTCAKGEPEVVGRGSGSYPVEVHCYAAFLSGRGQIEDIFELHGDLLRTCSTDRVVSMLLTAESNACTFILSSSFAISTVNL